MEGKSMDQILLRSQISKDIFFATIFITILNVVDSLLTMIILDHGGSEANPVVSSIIQMYGDRFWLWKYAVVSLSLIIIFHLRKLRWVKSSLVAINFIYIGIVLYQIILICHLPKIY